MAIESDSKKVEIPYSIAKDLLESKIKDLRERINEILITWNQKDAEEFQRLTREGKIPEAEMDAIRIGNIIESLNEYEEIYANLWVDWLESCQDKIQRASKLLHTQLYKSILDNKIDLVDCVLKLTFRNGIIVYVTYNNHEEYSYHLMYTRNELDRERFDNYDKKWDVETKPHHFHIRGETTVIQSSMTGKLDNDIPKLIEFVFDRLNWKYMIRTMIYYVLTVAWGEKDIDEVVPTLVVANKSVLFE